MENQPAPEKKTSRVLYWSLVAGIIIVLNLFFNYSASLVFDEPVFDAYCPVELMSQTYATKDQCLTVGGSWTENTMPAIPQEKMTRPDMSQTITGWCNSTYTCQMGFDDAQQIYNRNVFIVLVVLGIISIVLGFTFAGISAVSMGLSLGGVLSLVIGSIRYWSDMNDIVRVLVLAVALAVLIWLGVKKIRE